MFAKPPLAIDQTQPHERLLSRSPLKPGRPPMRSASSPCSNEISRATVQSDLSYRPSTRSATRADPLALRERQRAEGEREKRRLGLVA